MKKLTLILFLMLLFVGAFYSQQNPDHQREGFSEQVSEFPPVEAETDSTGYVYFRFYKPYPYFKYINGINILLMTSDQSRQIASDISDYSIMDSIIVSYEFKNAFYVNLIEQKDLTIIDLEDIISQRDNTINAHDSILANKDKISDEKDIELSLLKEDIETKNKALKKQKTLVGASLGVAIAAPVLALIFGNR